jgi:diacylglycerol kinase (ATP)
LNDTDIAPATSSSPTRHAFVVLNPVAGRGAAEDVRRAFERLFPADRTACEIHETVRDERIAEVVGDAVARGCDLVVAAGGDGTVSAVANGLVGSDVPLGIIPMGTANVLARELGIPVDLESACRLVAGEHSTTRIDAMRVGGECYFTQVGVGIDALMIRDTRREDKRRFGRVAYLWTAFTSLLGFQPRRFVLTTDGHEYRGRASQIVVANCGILGQPPFRWGPDIHPDDGHLDVCVIRARSVLDYVTISGRVLTGRHRSSPHIRYLQAHREVVIAARHTHHQPLPVQGDGEIIGQTPVTVGVVAGAVAVVVPR